MKISRLLQNKIFVLAFIVLIASVLRFYALGSVPPSPDWDEAALGYNAYSILHTARDEYGKFLPVIFRSFDDYKPGLYVYLIVPFIKLFGLSLTTVRLPAAIFGVLSVIGTYFLVRQLCSDYSQKLRFGLLGISEIAAFMLAISPWHIQFSHTAFEASVGMALNIFFVLFFLKGLKRPWYLFLSVFFATASMYVYQSEKVFVPLLGLLIVAIYVRELKNIGWKYIFTLCLFGLILLGPLISFTLTNKEVFARAQGVSIFADAQNLLKSDASRLIIDKSNNDAIGMVVDNRRLVFAKVIIANYLSHFDLNWLYTTGDIARHHAPGMGLLYLWDLPFLFMGIYATFFGTLAKKIKVLIFGWFLLVPIPASITSGVPHAIRTLNFLPLFQIFIAFGIIVSLKKVMGISYRVLRIQVKYIILFLYFIFVVFNFLYYLNQYFVQQDYFNAVDWQYGYAKMVLFVKLNERSYKKIIVSNQPYMDQSYIFFLFYLRYDPATYLSQSEHASGGFKQEHWFGKFEFRPIDWNTEEKSKQILYVGRAQDFSSSAKKIFEVDFPNGAPDMVAIEGQ